MEEKAARYYSMKMSECRQLKDGRLGIGIVQFAPPCHQDFDYFDHSPFTPHLRCMEGSKLCLTIMHDKVNEQR